MSSGGAGFKGYKGAEHRYFDGKVYTVSEGSQEEEDQYNLCSGDQMGNLGSLVVEVRRVNDRMMMMIELVTGGLTLNIICAYAPQADLVEKGFGLGDINEGRVSLLDFIEAFDFVTANSSFPKKEDHLVTFCSMVAKTQIDVFLFRKCDKSIYKDFKVNPSEYVITQDKLLVMDLEIKRKKRALIWGEIDGDGALGVVGTQIGSSWRGPGVWRGNVGGHRWNGGGMEKSKTGKGSMVKEAHIRRRWQTYFYKLLKEKQNMIIVLVLEHCESCREFEYCRGIKFEEVKEVICKMRSKGKSCMEWLTGLFNVTSRTSKMPEQWISSFAKTCYESLVEGDGDDELIWIHVKVFNYKSYSSRKDIDGSIWGEEDRHTYRDVWRLGVYMDQFLALLFALVMDKLTRHIQGEVSWCMLFTDDIVLIKETPREVNDRLEVFEIDLGV
ncbi:hypothetical protein H5410_057714 [Solanum commersonii]|uniref:Uncharacterized protein n=1 Tax=Solanum commersonii TaxID=4109 RepID=A0A9J5WQZ6_SOLCO|nr:hypothetical protein H5410_057714 [Solanum commersonii]